MHLIGCCVLLLALCCQVCLPAPLPGLLPGSSSPIANISTSSNTTSNLNTLRTSLLHRIICGQSSSLQPSRILYPGYFKSGNLALCSNIINNNNHLPNLLKNLKSSTTTTTIASTIKPKNTNSLLMQQVKSLIEAHKNMEQAEKTKEKGKSGVNETVNEVDVSSDHDGGEGSFIHLAADEEEQDNTNDVQVSKYADAVNFIEDYFDVKLWEDEDFAHLHPTAPLYDDNEDDEDLVMIEMDDTSL